MNNHILQKILNILSVISIILLLSGCSIRMDSLHHERLENIAREAPPQKVLADPEITALESFDEDRLLIGTARGYVFVWDGMSGKHNHYHNWYNKLTPYEIKEPHSKESCEYGIRDLLIDKESSRCWETSAKGVAAFRYNNERGQLVLDQYHRVVEVPDYDYLCSQVASYAIIFSGENSDLPGAQFKADPTETGRKIIQEFQVDNDWPSGIALWKNYLVYAYNRAFEAKVSFFEKGEKINEIFFEGEPPDIAGGYSRYESYYRNMIIRSQSDRLLMIVVPNGIVQITDEKKVVTYSFPYGYDYQVNDIQECADGSLVASLGKQGGLFRLKAEAIERQSSNGEKDWVCLKKKGAYDLAVTDKGTIYYANKSTVYKLDLDGKVTKCTEINSLRRKLCK